MKTIKIVIFIVFFIPSVYGTCQDFPILGEIFDFQVNDEFELLYFFCCNPTIMEVENIRIIQKQTAGDSLIYFRNKNRLNVSREIFPPIIFDTIYMNQSDTLIIYPVDSIIFVSGDSVFIDPNLYFGRQISISYKWIVNAEKVEKYVSGCGLVYSGWRNVPDSVCCVTDSLNFYKKRDEIWGQKWLAVNENAIDPAIKISPNPLWNDLNILISNINDWPKKIMVCDLTGKVILSIAPTYVNSNEIKIEFGNYPKGIYFINFISSKGYLSHKLVKL
jgi:hypothetical protein